MMEHLKVLVIEDEDITRSEIAELLTKEEYEVFTAANGDEGWESFQTISVDIVITDIRMPGLSGLQLLEKINRENPLIPVILVTAYGETDAAVQAIRLGAFDYIKKPIDLEDLFLALGRAKELIAKNRVFEEFPNILIAEDDTISRNSLADVLSKEDFYILTAQDGVEAFEAFKDNKVDIVLLDIKMPRLDGLGALKKMRGLSDDFEAIVLTGYGDEMTAIEALRQGAMSFIRKPIDLEEVLALIEKAQEKLSLHRSLKYRMREVNLANQIIAHISTSEQILIQFPDGMIQNIEKRVWDILNFLQDGVMLIGGDNCIHYANQSVMGTLGNTPVQITDGLLANLLKDLGHNIDIVGLRAIVSEAFAGSIGKLQEFSHLGSTLGLAAKIHVQVQRVHSDYVLLIIANQKFRKM